MFAGHLGRAPLAAFSGVASLVVVAIGARAAAWSAITAGLLSLLLVQGTEGWVFPLLLTALAVAGRRWGRWVAAGAVVVVWGAAAVSGLGVGGFLGSIGWAGLAAFGLLHLLAADPGWIPGTNPGAVETVFYDGHCGLCHHAVEFLLAEDADGSRFRYAPLDSEAFRAAVPEAVRASIPDSVVVQRAAGGGTVEVLVRSRAGLHLLERLGGLWRVVAVVGRLIPRGLADAGYDWIARVRHRLFARPGDVCPVMPAELRKRFLV